MKKIYLSLLMVLILSSVVSAQTENQLTAPADAITTDVQSETKEAPQAVTKGVKVKMDYTLSVGGEQVETSKGGQPLEYTHGMNMIIPGLEKELEGMKINESKKIVVKPEEGYGPVMEDMVVELPKSKLAEGVKPEKDMMLQFPTEDGNMIVGKVVDIMENDIKIDFNHPLAGKELTFDVTIVGLE